MSMSPGRSVFEPLEPRLLLATHMINVPCAADTFAVELDPSSTSSGSYSYVYVGDNLGANWAYLDFDIEGANIPSGSTIERAKLMVYVDGAYGSSWNTTKAYRLIEDWSESSVSWNERPAYTVTGGGSRDLNISDVGDWDYVFVNSIVRDWAENGQSNYGIILRPEVYPSVGMVKLDGAGSGHAPYISITYDDGTGPYPATTTVHNANMYELDSGTTNLAFTVEVTGTVVSPVTVHLRTVDGTAVSSGPDADFSSGSWSLTFSSPGTQQVMVPIHGDANVELDETFTVEIYEITNSEISDPTAIGMIKNDDDPADTPDPDDQISEAIAASVGMTINGALNPSHGDDVDMYGFSAQAGQTLGFDIDQLTNALDTAIRLFDSNGTELDISDDDPGPAPEGDTAESYLEYSFASSETYYLGVSEYGDDSYDPITGEGNPDMDSDGGGYTLIILEISPPPPPSLELVLENTYDSSDNPTDSFVQGDIVRVVLKARNAGPESVTGNWVLNIDRDGDHAMPYAFNSDPTPTDNNDMTIPNDGQWHYYSFDWVTADDEAIGDYDLAGAIRSANDWDVVLDDTEPGANTTSLGAPQAWILQEFAIGADLAVPYYSQGDSKWCWSTSTSMLLEYYGFSSKPWEVAACDDFNAPVNQGWSSEDVEKFLEAHYDFSESDAWVIEVKTAYQDIIQTVVQQLSAGNPVYVGATDQTHALVITGVEGVHFDDNVYFNDPDLPDGNHKEMLWVDYFLFYGQNAVLIYAQNTHPPTDATATVSVRHDSIRQDGIVFVNDFGGVNRSLALEWDGGEEYGYDYDPNVAGFYRPHAELGFSATGLDSLRIWPFVATSTSQSQELSIRRSVFKDVGGSWQLEDQWQTPWRTLSGYSADNKVSWVEDFSLSTLDNGEYLVHLAILDRSNFVHDTSQFRFAIDGAVGNSDPQDILLSNASVPENSPADTIVGTLDTVDADAADSHTYELVSGTGDDDNGSFWIDGETLKTAESFNFEVKDTYSILVQTTDSGGLTFEKQFTITVTNINDAPVAENYTRDDGMEDESCGVTMPANDEDDDSLTYSVTSGPSHGTLSPGSPSKIYTPDDDWNGTDSFMFKVWDGHEYSNEATVTINIASVNDAPSFTNGSDQEVNEDAGTQAITDWATDISAGPSDETGQTLVFQVTNDNNGIFSEQPAISPDGTLTYTPAGDANGSATVTVVLKDNGGTANGGVDTSAPQTFTITVSATPPPLVILINEFESNPEGPDIEGEWVELYNPNATEVDISNWQLWDSLSISTLRHTFAEGTAIPGGGYLVQYFNPAFLNNGGDAIILKNAGGITVDETPAKSDLSDSNYCWARVPNGHDSDSESDWTFQESTKGYFNNQSPTDIALSNNTVAENQPAGTVVGVLSGTDPDPGQSATLTFILVSGYGDNSQFTIDPATKQLKTAAVFDYETQNSYNIKVRATDSGNPALSYDETFAIAVTDIDDVAPAVTAAAINDGLAQRSKVTSIAITFSEEVTLSAGALSLHNDTTGEDFDLSTVPFNATTCTWDTSDVALTDGYYTGTLAAAGVEDTAGNPMASDYEFTFHVLKCDANGDRKVDGGDLAIWQQHYDPLGQNPNTPGMGDWNGDGKVDGGDLALWQQRYNPIGLPVPMKAGAAPALAEVEPTSVPELTATPLATADASAGSLGSESSAVGNVLGNEFLYLSDRGGAETDTQPPTGWEVTLPQAEGTAITAAAMPEGGTEADSLNTAEAPNEAAGLLWGTNAQGTQMPAEASDLGDGLEDILALAELTVPLGA